jgi:hypothetical protein
MWAFLTLLVVGVGAQLWWHASGLDMILFPRPRPVYEFNTKHGFRKLGRDIFWCKIQAGVSNGICNRIARFCRYCCRCQCLRRRISYPIMLESNYNNQIETPLIIIYLHSNGENIDNGRQVLGQVAQHITLQKREKQDKQVKSKSIPPLLLLAPEYEGYSSEDYESIILPSASGAVRSVQNIIETIMKTNPRSKIVLICRSIGTGVGSKLLNILPSHLIKSVIFVSAFQSIKDIALELTGSVSSLVPDTVLDSKNELKTFVRMNKSNIPPMLFIHGHQDELISYRHSQTLSKIVPNSQLLLMEGTHNGLNWIPYAAQFIHQYL